MSYFCKMADLGVAYRAWHVFLGKAIHAYRVKHPREPLTRDCLAKIMGEPFHKALSEANIISGFKTAFNRDAIMSKLSRNAQDSPSAPSSWTVHPSAASRHSPNRQRPMAPCPTLPLRALSPREAVPASSVRSAASRRS